jgi:hypothetical protein
MPRRLKLSTIPKSLTERIFSPTISHFLPATPITPSHVSPAPQFQIMSDLHLELTATTPTTPDPYLHFSIPPRAPYLLLAGDIGLLVHHYPRYLTFLHRQTSNFTHVFLVLGNHEFYKSTHAETLRAAQRMESEQILAGKLSIMHRRRVDLSLPDGTEVSVLGATLHSHVPPDARDRVHRAVRDFTAIDGWSVERHNAEHELDRQWLKRELADIAAGGGGRGRKRKVVVVTHHAPSFVGTCAPVHGGSGVGSAFCTEIVEEVAGAEGGGNVRLWVFGHTHFCADFCVGGKKGRGGGVRMVANQRGYFDENGKSFDVGMVVGV